MKTLLYKYFKTNLLSQILEVVFIICTVKVYKVMALIKGIKIFWSGEMA